MLVVCYTNHALDQFLTGLIAFGHTNIIRVGGRSTNEALKDYSLWKKRRFLIRGWEESDSEDEMDSVDDLAFVLNELGQVRAAKGAIFSERSETEMELLHVQTDVENIYSKLRNGRLLSLHHLSGYIRQDIYDIFTEFEMQTKQKKVSILEVWLGLCPVSLESLSKDLTFQSQLGGNGQDRFRMQVSEDFETLMPEQERENEQNQIAVHRYTEEVHINSGGEEDGNDSSEEDKENDGETIDIEGEGNTLETRWATNTEEFRSDGNIHFLAEDSSDKDQEFLVINYDGFQYVGVKQKEMRRKIINSFARYDPMTEAEAQNVRHPFMLNEKNRWRLYKYWIFRYIENCNKKFAEFGREYDKCCARIKEVQEEEDEILLRKRDVVGMTTTCAARSRRILRNIKPKIVIVEEAAEVLEAHVLTALSKDTQHLVLIGDHKQLKPNPTVYKLAKDYNLELSLFERMVNNGMDCRMLNIQHRMRPEIARLLRHVYKDLQNHETVEHYENIKGVATNMYFIDHSYEEQSNEELKSKSNQHEAEYIVGLCRYLLLQGYKPVQITVLTMYTGQLLLLKKLMPRSRFDGVRVTAVDNFQGEENDIVLLSLVRSNDGQIGFLKTENRICVALSRAKKRLYVIGNFTLMAQQSSLWAKILKDLKEANRIGTELQLTCQNHPGQVTHVKTAKDFKEAPEGGCNRPCNYRLPCGHVCDKACHPVDPNHKEYKCRKQCSKGQCLEGHLCKALCHQEKPCGPCFTSVRKTVPMCKHIQVMPCHRDPKNHCCNEVCKKPLKCGHSCAGKCGDICDDGSCKVIIFRMKKCSLTTPVPCSVSVEKVGCKEPCKGVLTCGHTCTGSCGRCQNGRLHVGCKSLCERVLVCSHLCKEPCTKQCPSCKEKCQNQCRHSKCQKPCGEVCDPCREPCSWRCAHQQCTKLCSQECDRSPCNQPCRKRLRFKCNHPCIGLCGEKCPQLCRVCDKETVEEIFFGTEDDPNARFLQLEDCGHVLEVSGLDHWMEMSQTGEDGKPVDIQLKGCPKCKTPIRRSLRYGNIIKAVLEDINAVKRKILEGGAGELSRVKRKIETEIREVLRKFPEDMAIDTDLDTIAFRMRREYGALRGRQSRGDFRSRFQERVSHSGGESLTQKLKLSLAACTNINQANILQNQVQFCHHLLQLRRRLKEMKDVLRTSLTCRRGDDLLPERHKHNKRYLEKYSILEQLKILTDFSMQPVLTSQQMEDIGLEISRMVLIFNVVDIKCKLKREGTSSLTRYDKGIIQEASKLLLAGNKIEQAKLDQLKEQCGAIRRKVGLGVLTQEERIMIIRASGLGKGHWFKCPRGHVYAIGDCGGANQESKCPECGAAIGGTSHRLAPGNEHASEFDGSRYAAWSEAANLANFDPQELRRLELGL